MTMVCAPLIGVSARTGFVVSAVAMLGDCLASFTKRRLGKKSESQAFGLDQVPESLFPLLALQSTYHLKLWGILITVIAFVIIELVLSRVLFYFKLRKHPY
jgi:CDP-2,3-bis-(O-geranylgeranyl)-sn-glycerol synthase